MFSIGNLQCNMSSNCFFPTQTQFLNLNDNNSNNSSISSIDNSRSSTPDTITTQDSNISNQSHNNNNNNSDSLALLAENERLKLEIARLKNLHQNPNIAEMCTNAIKDVEYHMNEMNKWKKLCEKMERKKEDEERKLLEERKKKRKFAHILYEFGCSNKIIRQTQGDFEYSAEIRTYSVPKVTKLRWQTELYNKQDKVGYKEVEFTNSSNLSLNINDLKIIDSKNPNLKISYSIKKLNSSFGCIYEDDNNNNHQSHNSKHNRYKPGRVSSMSYYRQNNNNIINPDDHFLICFEHPIKKEEGIHSLSYRLFSRVKANTRRYKGNGCFGEKIDFDYQVKNY